MSNVAYQSRTQPVAEAPHLVGHPVTVMQVLPSLVAGGAERGCIDVATALIQAGGRAIVVSNGGPMIHELERAGALHITMDVATKNPFKIRRNAARLAKLIKTHRVDIIHARSRAPAWSALRAAQRTKIPFVTTFHAAYKFNSEVKKNYNSVMAKGDRVIAISEFIAQHIRDTYAIDEANLRIIPRGVDLTRFNRNRVSEERMIKLLQTWRVPDDLPILLMPARLSRIKGHSVLIEALARRGKKDVYCVIVGATKANDPYRRELEALIHARKLEGTVRIVDHCADMSAAYNLAAVVVAPSIVPEGFGRVPVEAQAIGRPVIASDLGGFRETITHGLTGLLVAPGDAAALAEAIDAALNLSEEERTALAERAEQHIQSCFSKQQMCAATLDVYRELLQSKAVKAL